MLYQGITITILFMLTLLLSACGAPEALNTPGMAEPYPVGSPAVEPATEPVVQPATEPAATLDPDESVSSDDPVQPGPPAWMPAPGDEALSRGEAFVDQHDLLTLESYPLQFMLNLKGSLPTPCHQLRAKITPPGEDKRLQVEVYSLADPGQVCTQVLEPFEVNLPLGSYTGGPYTLWLNGEQIGEFQG